MSNFKPPGIPSNGFLNDLGLKWDPLDYYLGKGGYGIVYKGHYDNQYVAVKQMFIDEGRGRRTSKETLRAVSAVWKGLENEHITKLYCSGIDNSCMYYIMEYAEQGSLHDILSDLALNDKCLTFNNFFKWSTGVCLGLDFLHSRETPIIHRDLKSDNILISKDGEAKLCDFDFVREVNPIASSILSSGGAPAYTAPELMNRSMNRCECGLCDIFSYSFILWHMLTCVLPTDALECQCHPAFLQTKFLIEIGNGWRPWKPKWCPEALWEVIEKCWQTEPKHRPQTAKILQDMLKKCRETLLQQVPGADQLTLKSACKHRQLICNELQDDMRQHMPVYYHKRYKEPFVIDSWGEKNGFKFPYSIVADRERIYVTENHSDRIVQVFDFDFNWLGKINKGQGEGHCSWIRGMTLTNKGDLAIVDNWDNDVKIYTTSGRYVAKFGEKGTGSGLLNYPWGIACDENGLFYVVDSDNSRVQVFSPEYRWLFEFGKQEMLTPMFVAAKENRVFVTDHDFIHVYDVRGKHVKHEKSVDRSAGIREMKFNSLEDVVVDEDGNLLVVDGGGKRVHVLSRNFEYVTDFGKDYLKSPVGAVVLPDKRVIISDIKTQQLHVY